MRGTITWALAAGGAIAGWGALLLQYGLLARTLGAAGAGAGIIVWRYFGFFTIIANIGAALVLSHAALRPAARRGLGHPYTEMAIASAILMVGIVYSVALRNIWNPQGWQLAADRLLHDVMPLLFGLFWLLRPHGDLAWRDAALGMILPAAYCAYALARGTLDGWYAYWFLDPSRLGWGPLLGSVILLTLAFLAMSLILVTIDRLLARRPGVSGC